MSGAFLGPRFPQAEIERRLTAAGAKFAVLGEDEMIETTAQALAGQKAVGWFQGRMEFGPRSLGARSILGDPRSPEMQKNLNLKVKYRESFRPFAPAVLREDVSEWFDLASDSPYMLIVADVRQDKRRHMTPDEQALFGIDKLNVARSEIPAVTHVDYSARIQTVHGDTNPLFHKLLGRFKALTGCPSSSTPASTFAANRSCARRKTRFAASWATSSTCWWSATACCRRPSRIPASRAIQRSLEGMIFREWGAAAGSRPVLQKNTAERKKKKKKTKEKKSPTTHHHPPPGKNGKNPYHK